MSAKIDIVFDKKVDVFQAGEKICGKVTLDLDSDIKTRGVLIQCLGKCLNSWLEWGHRTYYRKTEKYIDNQLCLWPHGGKQVGGVVMKAGQYRFPFEFEVPDTAPPSFEGGVGAISYHLEVCVDRVLIPTNFTFKKKFTVQRRGELNEEELTTEASGERSPTLLGSQPPVHVTVVCDKPTYNSGDVIKVTVNVKETGEFHAEKIRLVLRRTCIFEGRSLFTFHKRTHENVSDITETLGTNRRGPMQWRGQIAVPEVVASHLTGCSIIRLYYKLNVMVQCGREITVKVPLQINCASDEKQWTSRDGEHGFSDDLPSYSSLVPQEKTQQLF